jgi:dTDP-glucose 4,6-dehydratase
MKLLVTGGAGFIGSTFVRSVLQSRLDATVVTLDKLTYAGNLENLAPVESLGRHTFVRGDIADRALVGDLVETHQPEAIVHFAAETHVDRSILSGAAFIDTNVRGTFTLLEAAREHGAITFVHVSTDEVYGSIAEPDFADETWPLSASSPYSASKAGSDLLALSYFTTYKLPVMVTRASNNYGPYQFPEKLIPLMICNTLEGKQLPIYGDGMQIRDWLHVEDHCRAILAVLESGRAGQVYNIGGTESLPNRTVVRMILEQMSLPEELMVRVADRPGHDRRYALSSEKIRRDTGWTPAMSFERGLADTVNWYRTNPEWVRRVKTGEYQQYYAANYAGRKRCRRDRTTVLSVPHKHRIPEGR